MNNSDNAGPLGLTPDQLQQFIDSHAEKEYILIDVRQPQEYSLGHIPGAHLLPLLDFEAKLFELPENRDLVFYCRNGARSLAAATLAVDAEVSNAQIYNLSGGILAWYGKTLTDFPKLQTFESRAGLSGMLYTAMDLEKGAWRFYRHVMDRYTEQISLETFEKLSAAETAHARTIYKKWQQDRPDAPPFDQFFETLKGDIIEGGQTIEDILAKLPDSSDNPCLDMVELALQIEIAAFDLYRVMADQKDEPELSATFLSLAQAEKSHMRMLIQSLTKCADS